jgi:hypothetical protein
VEQRLTLSTIFNVGKFSQPSFLLFWSHFVELLLTNVHQTCFWSFSKALGLVHKRNFPKTISLAYLLQRHWRRKESFITLTSEEGSSVTFQPSPLSHGPDGEIRGTQLRGALWRYFQRLSFNYLVTNIFTIDNGEKIDCSLARPTCLVLVV